VETWIAFAVVLIAAARYSERLRSRGVGPSTGRRSFTERKLKENRRKS
jgi:hypothetical protein